mmetsp:Transcript_10809/g.12877  ORF Transcript_10809/g.12877 Transcript_10809/m.12877 type:complete len:123 (+) Transcript_10809:106-474(+)
MSATANSKFRPMEGGADVISTTTTWSLATVSELLSDWPENRSMYLEAVDRDDEMGIDEQLESETSSSTIESTSDEDQYSDGDLSELYIASKILARGVILQSYENSPQSCFASKESCQMCVVS